MTFYLKRIIRIIRTYLVTKLNSFLLTGLKYNESKIIRKVYIVTLM